MGLCLVEQWIMVGVCGKEGFPSSESVELGFLMAF